MSTSSSLIKSTQSILSPYSIFFPCRLCSLPYSNKFKSILIKCYYLLPHQRHNIPKLHQKGKSWVKDAPSESHDENYVLTLSHDNRKNIPSNLSCFLRHISSTIHYPLYSPLHLGSPHSRKFDMVAKAVPDTVKMKSNPKVARSIVVPWYNSADVPVMCRCQPLFLPTNPITSQEGRCTLF